MTLTNCTVARNSIDQGGHGAGLATEGEGTTVLFNTIVALNVLDNGTDPATPNDIFGPASPGTSAFNLIGTGGAGGLTNGVKGNKVGVADPKLGPLASNGGPTQTIVLLSGSPAINAGSNAKAVGPDGKPLTTDQRGGGFPRIAGGTVDIGAFEVQTSAVATGSVSGLVFKDLNGNRVRDAGEGVLSNWLVWADLNRDGRLNANEPRTVSNTSGKYVLANVPVGFQLLRLEKRAGWQQTYPARRRGPRPDDPRRQADHRLGLRRAADRGMRERGRDGVR